MSNFAVLAREFLAVDEAAERQAAVDPTAAASFAGKTVEVVEKEARGDMWRDEPRPIRLPWMTAGCGRCRFVVD